MQDQCLGLGLRIEWLRTRFWERKKPRVQEQGVGDGQRRETIIWRRGENMEERSTAERVTDELDGGEVNPIVEGSPVDGNVIHARELSTVAIDHERF